MNNLEKIKYIDEKIQHLRIQKRNILKDIKNTKNQKINEKYLKREELGRRFCNGEKISLLAKEFGISKGTMFCKIKGLLAHKVFSNKLMKDIPYFYGMHGIQHYKKLLNDINYYK